MRINSEVLKPGTQSMSVNEMSCFRKHMYIFICEETDIAIMDSPVASQASLSEDILIVDSPLLKRPQAAGGSASPKRIRAAGAAEAADAAAVEAADAAAVEAAAAAAAADAAAAAADEGATSAAASVATPIMDAPQLQMPQLAAAADAVDAVDAAAVDDSSAEDSEPELWAWKVVRSDKSEKGPRAYLSAIFRADRKRHHVVEVSARQTSEYLRAVGELMEQAQSMNYTKEATVACRDRLLREQRWKPGLTLPRPAKRSLIKRSDLNAADMSAAENAADMTES